ncbi:hypothetical protein GCM10018782_06270 [Streptomyces griseoaurantiacus]|nr:hypothetical protein GCM10018782_06270 [Streptomyces griseoaurantiacus]
MGAQLGGEVEDRRRHRLGAPFAAGGPACPMEQLAFRPYQGGLHPGAAHIKGDDVFHVEQCDAPTRRGLVH